MKQIWINCNLKQKIRKKMKRRKLNIQMNLTQFQLLEVEKVFMNLKLYPKINRFQIIKNCSMKMNIIKKNSKNPLLLNILKLKNLKTIIKKNKINL